MKGVVTDVNGREHYYIKGTWDKYMVHYPAVYACVLSFLFASKGFETAHIVPAMCMCACVRRGVVLLECIWVGEWVDVRVCV